MGNRRGVLMVREEKLQLHVWFDRKLVQHLDGFATKWGISRSELIRVAVASYLTKGQSPFKRIIAIRKAASWKTRKKGVR